MPIAGSRCANATTTSSRTSATVATCLSRTLRRLQDGSVAAAPADRALHCLPTHRNDSRPVDCRESRKVGPARSSQAPPALHARPARPALRRRRAQAVVRLQSRRRTAQQRVAQRRPDRDRLHRPRGRKNHDQHSRSRRCGARTACASVSRGPPHAHRPLPPRNRPLLLGHPGAETARRTKFRKLFGDHNAVPYADAMNAYYQNGPRETGSSRTSAPTLRPTRGKTSRRRSVCTST